MSIGVFWEVIACSWTAARLLALSTICFDDSHRFASLAPPGRDPNGSICIATWVGHIQSLGIQSYRTSEGTTGPSKPTS